MPKFMYSLSSKSPVFPKTWLGPISSKKNLVIKLNLDGTKNNIALSFKIPMAVISKSDKRLEKVVDGRFRDQQSRLRTRAKHGVDEFAIGWSRPWSPWLKGY